MESTDDGWALEGTLHVPSHCLAPVVEWIQFMRFSSVIICEGERFEKSGYSNRYRIAAANGPLLLTIPVVGGRAVRKPVAEVSVCYEHDWRRQHVRSWKAAYGKSPFFLYYGDELIAELCSGEKNLAVLNRKLLLCCLRLLDLKINLTFSNEPLPKAKVNEPIMVRPYRQVFATRFGFLSNMSIIDLLFNMGPDAVTYLFRQ
ncbi:MAG: WbqC family protein [Chitinophagales bacterium]|nr:WbqC family protein [Chitinophagales bacterium]MDW8427673.1 WbqC family protein [Chitinophagales bacterium]